jgi:hypothetical protein
MSHQLLASLTDPVFDGPPPIEAPPPKEICLTLTIQKDVTYKECDKEIKFLETLGWSVNVTSEEEL